MTKQENTFKGAMEMDLKTAHRLADLRKENGYSQEALAKELGLSRQAVSKWERGESSPDTDNLIALAKLYGITLDELLNNPLNGEEAVGEECVEEEPEIDQEAEQVDEEPADGLPHIDSDGFHVDDGKSSVHIGWDGIHVNEYGKKDGDIVDVDWHGVHVHEGGANGHVVNVGRDGVAVDGDRNSWKNAREKYSHFSHGQNRKGIGIVFMGYVILAFAWLLAGVFLSFDEALPCYFGSAAIWSVVSSFIFKDPDRVWAQYVPMFNLALGAFTFGGICMNAWHPGWLVLLAIPVWGAFIAAVRAREHHR